MIGQQLGSYVIESCIGDGGMGSVYLGRNPSSGERAAIKILHPELARNAEMVERILREGRAAGSIAHPGVVKIFDSGLTPKGRPYVIMEYLEGQTLSAYMAERRKLPLPEALRIGQELASALMAAHAKQVIHRDLKPDNIFRVNSAAPSEPRHVKILDFGIALVETPGDRKRLTRAGSLLGTPAYMAPELVIDPRAASAASDAYSLGVILYQMLAGEPPFSAECANAVLFKQVSEPPPALSVRAPESPPALCTLVQRLLAKNPVERPTMIETFWVLMGIERSLPPPTSLAQRVWRGNFVQRSVLWIAPSLFICAMAAGITHQPRTAAVTPAPAPAPSPGPGLGHALAPPTQPPVPAPVPASSVAVPSETLDASPPSGAFPPLRLASVPPIYAPSSVKGAVGSAHPQPRSITAHNFVKPSPLEAAKVAYGQRRYDDAIGLAQSVAREVPYEAWKLIGRAACMKKDRKLVKEALHRLDAPGQSMVTFACKQTDFAPF